MFEQQTYSSRKDRRKKSEMVSTRAACLLILLILTVWHSVALPHQDVSAAAATIGKRGPMEGAFASSATTTASYRRLRGRKMVVDKKQDEVKENTTNGGSSLKISNTKHIINDGGKNLHQDEMYGVGFVGLNSDYRPPRHHPPKNN